MVMTVLNNYLITSAFKIYFKFICYLFWCYYSAIPLDTFSDRKPTDQICLVPLYIRSTKFENDITNRKFLFLD